MPHESLRSPLPLIALLLTLKACGIAAAEDAATLGRFDVERDLLLAQFDLKTDVDDVHSVAAVATMLADPRLAGVRSHAVAGAYGVQTGPYVPANELFEAAFGDHWSDAHTDRQRAVGDVARLVEQTLRRGGDVWVAEGGQSDFSAAVLERVAESTPAADLAERFHVVQHSDWNEKSASPDALDHVRRRAAYHKIPDGNARGNGTPGLKTDGAIDWRARVTDPRLAALWDQALTIANQYNGREGRYHNGAIAEGGFDFSDASEVCWVFGFEGLADAEQFFDEFATRAE
ncbi:hypothetical protein Mal64_25830 [Pseudobythopirellula maris]|uniref:Uncharacterized protein n=1 Tax=Pseudobythopirellula maris TaxID=2527991 RepID=A0A5C5ZQM2_9BACT|nr:hypothetical protein [Pseudobythopirellula maris]TWT89091.1 hypothetical protein Mal64_25830 [Pseudobythopirellula maris]